MKQLLPSFSPNRYLFVIPPTTTLEEQKEVVRAAKKLLPDDYVCVVSAHEGTAEDRENVYYLPLRRHDIPSFGAVAGVMVARDTYLAQLAREAYPGVPVMVFDPADSPMGQSAEQVRARRVVSKGKSGARRLHHAA